MKPENKWSGIGEVIKKSSVTIEDSRGNYKVTDISVVCDRQVKGQLKSTTVPLECWGTMSEACDNIETGDWVKVVGRFENKSWNNKAGIRQTKNLVVVESIEKL